MNKIARCPRCDGRVRFDQEEPRCFVCGYRDFTQTNNTHEVFWGIERLSTVMPGQPQMGVWKWKTHLTRPSEVVNIVVEYVTHKAPAKNGYQPHYAIPLEIRGWPWHRWTDSTGGQRLRTAFMADVGLPLHEMSAYLESRRERD